MHSDWIPTSIYLKKKYLFGTFFCCVKLRTLSSQTQKRQKIQEQLVPLVL